MDVFTSISLNYLPKARVLASSVKRFHPDWKFHLLISDRVTPAYNSENIDFREDPFDRIVWIDHLKIKDLNSWIFKHSVVELCTAVKGLFLQQLISEGAKKIIYLDPDTAVFNELTPLDKLLDQFAILMTPHLLNYVDDKHAILDNEVAGTLKHGTFNLGFFAINAEKSDGQGFGKWWGDRLRDFCYADYDLGLFTDQRWCDLVPSFFSDFHVIRDPGYNVASWNLNKRFLSMSEEGTILVNNEYPLRFYHFTGYDSGSGKIMTEHYGQANLIVDELWQWYHNELINFGHDKAREYKWYFNYYDNGEEIPKEARILYKNRSDLQTAFPDPYETRINSFTITSFYKWYQDYLSEQDNIRLKSESSIAQMQNDTNIQEKLQAELDEIKSSRMWKLVLLFWKIRVKIYPSRKYMNQRF